ncbi:HEPN family nuclease [Sphingobacterium multivorum]|uniref:HEPN family nuclease n=1 Tax=Sphingobacterium multivorum TaxID=28454 RepID=UPI00345EF744
MGNYRNIETEFIERTLHLISQYETIQHRYDFREQYNYTLLINCLLGVIVMPKEKNLSYLPAERLTTELKNQMGIVNSTFNERITDLKTLVVQLRHCVAHFNIDFESDDDNFLINRILFKDTEAGSDVLIASFVPEELLNFIRYYGNWIVSNLKLYHPQ